MSGAAFSLSGVTAGYGRGRDVLRGISAQIAAGMVTVLLGENGCGKSTLLRLLAGLLPPRRGELLFEGLPLAALPRRQAALRIAYLPQSFTPLFPATAYEVALLGRTPRLSTLGTPGNADRDATLAALAEMDVSHLAEADIREISGGERQRVLLARVLAGEPDVFLLDEPTANLDPRHRVLVVEALRRRALAGRTVVFSTHELEVASVAAAEAALLKAGSLLARGRVEDTLTGPLLTELFGVAARVVALPGGGPPLPLVGR